MTEPKRILVAYDGSQVAWEALQVAKDIGRLMGARIHVVTSLMGGREVPRQVFEHAERELRRAQADLKEQSVTCDTHLSVRGLEPGEDVVNWAVEHQMDFIFVGVRRRSKVGKLVFGSTAQFIILNAPCPVVTIK